ncbi:MAG: pyroglutamyl-peptidase I [Burkholderiales bacterium]
MPRALISGFEPFGGASVNASFEAVRRLPGRIGTLDITTLQLPTSYARASKVLLDAIARVDPVLVLCVGEAGERTALNIERVAINVQDARIADNDGAQPVDLPIVDGAPAAYFTTLPVRAIHESLAAAGLSSAISNSAGTFVCNHLFYTLMQFALTENKRLRGGFLHVPCWRSDTAATPNGTPPMILADIVRGLTIVLEASAATI